MASFILFVVVCSAKSFVDVPGPIKDNDFDDVYIQHSVFHNLIDNCLTVAGGGAIGIGSNVRSVSISDCTFITCRSIPIQFVGSPVGGFGGACFIAISSVSITRCCGESCWAPYGLFIYFLSRGNVTMTSVVHCVPYSTASSEAGYGVVYLTSTGSTTAMNHLNFSDCFVQQQGSAFFVATPALTLESSFDFQYMTIVNCSGRSTIYSQLSVVAESSISYSNFVNNDARLAVLYGNTHGMSVKFCKFRNRKNITLFNYGDGSFARRFLVSYCDFSGDIVLLSKVSLTECHNNTRVVTWPICFFNTMVCPAKCYSDAFTASNGVLWSSNTFMFSQPFISSHLFWQSENLVRTVILPSFSIAKSLQAFADSNCFQSQLFLSTGSENLVPTVILPSFSIAKSLKAFVDSNCFQSQLFLSTGSENLVPTELFTSFPIGESLLSFTNSDCFLSRPLLRETSKGPETDQFYFTALFGETLLKTYFTASFGQTSIRLTPRPKTPVPEGNLIPSNKIRLVVAISGLVAIGVFSALLICMVVVCIRRKRAKDTHAEGLASWQSDPVRCHELETLAAADMGRTDNSSLDVLSSSAPPGRDIVTENLLRDFL